MSYNGIGLPTPRGTGTSGYIQKNVSSISASRQYRSYERRQELAREEEKRKKAFDARNFSNRKIDEGIIEHERKRKIEAQCVELQAYLENEREEAQAEGKPEKDLITDDEIEEKVAALRAKLKQREEEGNKREARIKQHFSSKHDDSEDNGRRKYKTHDIHNLVSAKARENERIRDAFDSEKRERNRRHHRERSLSPVRDDDINDRKKSQRSRSPVRRERYNDYHDRNEGSRYRPRNSNRSRDYMPEALDYDGGHRDRQHRRSDSRSPSPPHESSSRRHRGRSPGRRYDSRKPHYDSRESRDSRNFYPSSEPSHPPVLKKYSLPGSLPPPPLSKPPYPPPSSSPNSTEKKASSPPNLPPKPQERSSAGKENDLKKVQQEEQITVEINDIVDADLSTSEKDTRGPETEKDKPKTTSEDSVQKPEAETEPSKTHSLKQKSEIASTPSTKPVSELVKPENPVELEESVKSEKPVEPGNPEEPVITSKKRGRQPSKTTKTKLAKMTEAEVSNDLKTEVPVEEAQPDSEAQAQPQPELEPETEPEKPKTRRGRPRSAKSAPTAEAESNLNPPIKRVTRSQKPKSK